MNKFQTYFGQILTDDELNEIFGSFALAIEQFIQDFNYVGLAVGGEVVQNTAPNLTALVNGPLVAYDNNGNRILMASSQNVNCAIDENNQPTTVVGSSNEKYVSIFIGFRSIATDPREDELGNTLFFRHVGSYRFVVVQGAEAPVGTAPRPALRGDLVLLGDVRLIANQTTIQTADIRTDRTQLVFDLPGVPLSVKGRNLRAVLQAMVTTINAVNTDTLQVPAITGSPTSLPAGSVRAVFTAFLSAFNTLRNQVSGMPQNLNGLAHLGGEEEFSGKKIFNAIDLKSILNAVPASAGAGILGTGVAPNSLSEEWLLLFNFLHDTDHGADQYVKMYTGRDGTPTGRGAFIIAFNARWSVSNDRWEQINSAYVSMAVIFSYRRFRVSFVAANTANWTEWPSALPTGANSANAGAHIVGEAAVTGGIFAGGDAHAENIYARGGLSVAGQSTVNALHINGGITAAGDALVATGVDLTVDDITCDDLTAEDVRADTFLYRNTTTVVTDVKLAYGTPNINRSLYHPCWVWLGGVWQAVWWAQDNGPTPGSNPPGVQPCIMDVPLPIPGSARIRRVQIHHYQPTADSNDFRIYRLRSGDYSPGALAVAPPGGEVSGTDFWGVDSLSTSTGWQGANIESALGGTGHFVVSGSYVLRAFAGKTNVPTTNLGSLNSSSPAIFARARITWEDPGPRNY